MKIGLKMASMSNSGSVLDAADRALNAIGAFLAERLRGDAGR